MEASQLLSLNLSLKKNQKGLPKNIYAIKVLNVDKNETLCLAIEHDGYCPYIETEREESRFGDYLSNLEYKLIDNYFKLNKIKKPKSYYHLCEVITDSKGKLYRYSKTVQ